MAQYSITIKKNDHIVALRTVTTEWQAIKELITQGFQAQRMDSAGVAHYHRPVQTDGDRVLPGLHGEIRRIED